MKIRYQGVDTQPNVYQKKGIYKAPDNYELKVRQLSPLYRWQNRGTEMFRGYHASKWQCYLKWYSLT